jgi:hypothetical protein
MIGPSVAPSVVFFTLPSTVELTLWTGVVLTALLIAVLGITTAESIYQWRRGRRRERLRGAVEAGIERRLSDPVPAWDNWVRTLSSFERGLVREYLDEMLRGDELSPAERDALCELADALGIPAEAAETIRTGKRHERLQALSWLSLLEISPEPAVLSKHCTDGSDLRASAARVLYEADHEDATEIGTELLLGDGTEMLSMDGLDTLYRLHEDDPTPLLARGAREAGSWRTGLTVQVLRVIQYCSVVSRTASDERTADEWRWVLDATRAAEPSVRAAAVRALAPPKRDGDFRERIPAERLIEDPSRTVRQATYRTLGEWNDDASLRLLARAGRRETDQQSRLLALGELVDPGYEQSGLPGTGTVSVHPTTDAGQAAGAADGGNRAASADGIAPLSVLRGEETSVEETGEEETSVEETGEEETSVEETGEEETSVEETGEEETSVEETGEEETSEKGTSEKETGEEETSVEETGEEETSEKGTSEKGTGEEETEGLHSPESDTDEAYQDALSWVRAYRTATVNS